MAQSQDLRIKRILEGTDAWTGYYRKNPHRFAKDYLNVNLKLFQKILLYAMMNYEHFMFLASRSLGKTWLTALFCVIRCILFPGTKICVAAGTREQANEVLLKIEEDFYNKSSNLRKEISFKSIGQNRGVIRFHNGSWIQSVISKDNARGKRANLLILDEFRMIDKNTIDTVLKRFLGTPRQPPYLSLPEYKSRRKELLETNREVYMSSAWLKSHWSWEKTKVFVSRMLDPSVGYFCCALPYQLAIYEGLLNRDEIEAEMSEPDFNELTFSMEMEVKWFGNTDGAFFNFDDIDRRRKLQTAWYPPSDNVMIKFPKIPDLAPNERRILSLDVALMASGKNKDNDAAPIIINSAIPNGDKYIGNIMYTESYEGETTDNLALITRRRFAQFKCTDLVIDCSGNGLGVYDLLIKDMVDPETGEVYPALNCCNNKEMADRCKVYNAPEVIWAIKGNEAFNSDIAIGLRNAFKLGKLNLLIPEQDFENLKSTKDSAYKKMDDVIKLEYKKPYLQTTLLIFELINLLHTINGKKVKVHERSGKRKDRYSSLAYNYWVQEQLERKNLQSVNDSWGLEDYIREMKKLSKKPVSY